MEEVDVNFPARLSSLNQAAFKNCTKLENIIIDDGCENYRNGTNGFEDDVVLASPDFIANSDGYITQYRQNSNGKVSIPATLTDGTIVKGIAGRAFISKSLSEVEIPYTVEEIQSNAFMTCQNLTTIQVLCI